MSGKLSYESDITKTHCQLTSVLYLLHVSRGAQKGETDLILHKTKTNQPTRYSTNETVGTYWQSNNTCQNQTDLINLVTSSIIYNRNKFLNYKMFLQFFSLLDESFSEGHHVKQSNWHRSAGSGHIKPFCKELRLWQCLIPVTMGTWFIFI